MPGATEFGVDQDAGTSGFNKGGPVTTAGDADRFFAAADSLGQAMLPKLDKLLPCRSTVAADAADACVTQFITQFGARAFRRPLTAEESSDLLTLYRSLRGPDVGSDLPTAVSTLVTAILQAPQFLYRWELGSAKPIKDGSLIRFGPYEMASRLSYLFWASMPDEALFAAAAAGKLSTPAEIESQARRLLKDPRAADAISDFHTQWLDIDGLPFAQHPTMANYSPEVARAMAAETRAFVSDVVLGARSGGGLRTLLTSSTSYVNEPLAKVYGLAGVTGPQMKPMMLDPTQRAGVLTHGSFLTVHASPAQSHPVRRGAEVLRRLLCQDIQPPKDLMVTPVPDGKPGTTTRERYAMHAMNPCASCHRLTDPIGFAFEHYDAIGAYRDSDAGKKVDASGVINLDGADLHFNDAIDLSKGLSNSKTVRDCVATQWLRFSLRREELVGETPTVRRVEDTFTRTNEDVRELMVAIATSRAFTHRTASPGEAMP